MKTKVLTLITFIITSLSFAQGGGFNYKALITDNGNVLATHSVTIKFTVLENGSTSVYQETQSATTDANGIAAVNIGEGTVVSGNFTTIDWGNSPYFLKVEIDTGSGYQDFGTAEFKAVPYAKYAEKAGNTFSGNFGDLSNVPSGLSDGDDDTHLTETQVDSYVANNGYLTQVDNIQGIPVSSTTPANGQVLKYNGTQFVPADDDTSGGSGTDGVVNSANFSGTTTKTLTLSRSNGLGNVTATFTDAVNDADHSATNELQTISGSGSTITLSNGGGSVTLPDQHDADFYKVGSTTPPTNINDFIYTYGRVGIGVDSPSGQLEIKGDGTEAQLILSSATNNSANRPGIQFKNNTSQYIAGDDGSNEIFGFYSKWANNRTYDAKLRVYGKASDSWGKYVEITHDGTDAAIKTDTGNISLEPQGGKIEINGSNVGISPNVRTHGDIHIGYGAASGGGLYFGTNSYSWNSGDYIRQTAVGKLDLLAGGTNGTQMIVDNSFNGAKVVNKGDAWLRIAADNDNSGGDDGTQNAYLQFTTDGGNNSYDGLIWLENLSGDTKLHFDVENQETMVMHDGNVQIPGKITAPATCSNDLKAFAYGTIKWDGSMLSGTGNFNIDHNSGAGIYKITFHDVNNSTINVDNAHFTTVVSVKSYDYSTPHFIFSYVYNNTLVVKIYQTDGTTRENQNFSFVTYKN